MRRGWGDAFRSPVGVANILMRGSNDSLEGTGSDRLTLHRVGWSTPLHLPCKEIKGWWSVLAHEVGSLQWKRRGWWSTWRGYKGGGRGSSRRPCTHFSLPFSASPPARAPMSLPLGLFPVLARP
eukprot:753023-Hanusia_phi.AAC.11